MTIIVFAADACAAAAAIYVVIFLSIFHCSYLYFHLFLIPPYQNTQKVGAN